MAEEKKLIPKRRFKEFQNAGDWEQRKLGELSNSIEYGLNAAAKEFDGKNRYIRITDINDDSHNFVVEDVTSPDTDLSNSDNYKLSVGDILFARTGASVGKSYIYKDSDGLVYYAGFLIRARIKEDYNPEFVFQNTLTKDYEKYITITSQRSGQPGVNAQEYSEYKIFVPKRPEQDKISDYLRNLDNLITLHQRKLEKIKSIKKAYLYEMFPAEGESKPKRRFKGFTDDWEQRKLGEVTTYYNGGSFENDVQENGQYELITLKSINMDGKLVHSGRYVDIEAPTLTKGTLVMILSEQSPGLLGMTAQIPIDNMYILNQRVAEIRPYASVNSYFLSMVINKNQRYFSKCGAGTKVQNISKSNVEKFEFLCPSLQEQETIGTFFEDIDSLITLHQRKLDKLQDLKKAYLNEMFV